jgi:microcystin-dependent protein
MSDSFIGQISLFAFNFAPYNWAQCAGQTLAIQQYTALFSLLGTTYGGNGTSNFCLPDLRGIVPRGQGQGPGLPPYNLGDTGGVETVTLTDQQAPPAGHTHTLMTNPVQATSKSPSGNVLAIPISSDTPRPARGAIYTPNGPTVRLGSFVNAVQGGNQPHTNLQPALALNYCICLSGLFPERG